MNIGSAAKSGLALTLAGGIVCAASSPLNAGDDDVLSTGIIGATTLGILAGSTFAAGPPAPPPPALSYYAPAFAPQLGPYGLRCWHEARQVWDGYGFVVGRVRVCD